MGQTRRWWLGSIGQLWCIFSYIVQKHGSTHLPWSSSLKPSTTILISKRAHYFWKSYGSKTAGVFASFLHPQLIFMSISWIFEWYLQTVLSWLNFLYIPLFLVELLLREPKCSKKHPSIFSSPKLLSFREKWFCIFEWDLQTDLSWLIHLEISLFLVELLLREPNFAHTHTQSTLAVM